MKAEKILKPMLSNLDTPALSHYHQEILEICNEMIMIKKEVTPVIAGIFTQLLKVAEISGYLMHARTFTLFVSYGSSYLLENQKLYERVVNVLEYQIVEALNNLRMDAIEVDSSVEDSSFASIDMELMSQPTAGGRSSGALRKKTTKQKGTEAAQIRIPRFNQALWDKRINFAVEILTISQLLFLNNFSELLCKKAKVMLSAVFNNLKLDGSCENLIVGQPNIEA